MNYSHFSIKSNDLLEKELKSSIPYGLSTMEAKKRQKAYGFNEIETYQVKWWTILLRQFNTSFQILLSFACIVSFFLGEILNGSMILLFILINTIIGFAQEYQAEMDLYLLKKFIISKDKVLRDGKELLVESKELVPGDIIFLEPGDIISADIRILSQQNLSVDESSLSGESEPAKKISTTLKKSPKTISEAFNIGFCGTKVISGKGIGIIFATAKQTMFGEIAKITSEVYRQSAIGREISNFSKFILYMVLGTLSVIFFLNLIIKGGNVDIVQLAIFSVALAVTIIPEALPIVMTCSLSRSAMRLAKNKVIVKRLSAIEDLGGIDILCTDKTGTLTENLLSIKDIFSQDPKETLLYGALASTSSRQISIQGINSFDSAILNALSKNKKDLEAYELVDEIPFDPFRRRNTAILKKDGKLILISRGAEESILEKCTKVSSEEKQKLHEWKYHQGQEGRRVLAVAKKILSPHYSSIEKEEENLEFLGLISFEDPIKRTAFHTLKKAKKLNVQIKILTGDSPEVAGAVGVKLKLIKSPGEVILGSDLDKMSAPQQEESIENGVVFARIIPTQKYKIIQILQEKYDVGFLGEGINDAPALKIAQVGIVVNNATDIAKDAADIVLMKTSLRIIIDGIEQGREAFANSIKYIKFTLASNLSNFYTVAFSSLLLDYLPMLPLQILLVNLLSDLPMIAISTDNIDMEELKKVHNFRISRLIAIVFILGITTSIFDFSFFAFFFKKPAAILQTNWFIFSMLTEIAFFFSIRTKLFFLKAKHPSLILSSLLLCSLGFALIIPFTKIGNMIFKFEPPTLNHLLIIFGIVGLCFIAVESIKLLYYRQFTSNDATNNNKATKN